MRFITPIILIGMSIGIFFVFTNSIYGDISTLRVQEASYNEALNNSKALENQRDVLTAKYNAISPDDLQKLQKLVPDNIDNIRLILEIEQIAAPYKMVLKNIQYNPTSTTQSAVPGAVATPGSVSPVAAQSSGKNYGTWDLEFSTSGSYDNFLNFTRALDSNLRIVDISSVDISPSNGTTSTPGSTSSSDAYTYNFKIKTYWLEN